MYNRFQTLAGTQIPVRQH